MVVIWLVPREFAAVSELFLCTPTIYQFTVSLYLKPDTSDACVSRCNLSHALLTEWPDLFCLFCFVFDASSGTRSGTDTEVRVSTESCPWRRTLPSLSCQDSNPGPFDHESVAVALSHPSLVLVKPVSQQRRDPKATDCWVSHNFAVCSYDFSENIKHFEHQRRNQSSVDCQGGNVDSISICQNCRNKPN